MKLSVIIVNWNTSEMLDQCLEVVYQFLEGVEKEVLVIDNASTDDSCAMVREKYKDAVLTANRENVGPVAANNQGIKMAAGDLLLFLNTDAFLFDTSLQDMISYLDKNPRVGAIGPKLLNDDGTWQVVPFTFPTVGERISGSFSFLNRVFQAEDEELEDYPGVNPVQVNWLPTACLLVRRKVFEDAGMFDENYFILCEDADFFIRVSRTGWQAVFYPQAQVIHQGGGSSGTDEVMKKLKNTRYLEISQHSWHYYYKKNFGISALLVIKISELTASGLRILGGILRLANPVGYTVKWYKIRYELIRVKLNLTRL